MSMTSTQAHHAYLVEMRGNPRDPRHGCEKGYRYGCRCERCKEAHKAHCKANVAAMRTSLNKSHAKALLEMADDPGDRRHGTRYGYDCGCRCERCREAMRESRERKCRWVYRFPEHRDAKSATAAGQAGKVAEEASELMSAVNGGECDDRVIEEALDTIHACETLLRRWPSRRIAEAREKVIEKNRARSYYGKEEQ